MKAIYTSILAVAFAAGCGDAPDLGNPDSYPMQVTRYTDDNGSEHVEYKQLPFDYDLYGQARQALISAAPPDRYGINSAPSSQSDTRCPSGGYTSGSNYCEMTGVKHINWNLSAVASQADQGMKIKVRDYVIQGLSVAAADAAPSGFVHENGNPNRGIDGVMKFEVFACPVAGTSGFAYMCVTSNVGPVTLAGGQRVRLDAGNYVVHINPAKINSLKTGTASQQGFSVLNFTAHEVGHTDGFGHVPSSAGAETMNLQTGATNAQILHLSSAEKSQLTTWVSTAF